ncbi:MAG: hypothetical protein JSW68_11970 [Burkholderiales bacterium]|nr:MAG: hypothetical protein JSW68_11970 [Burkholderiales bacterium]
MAKGWSPFPFDADDYRYTEASLKKHWARLHRGDCEPWPSDKAVVQAWIAYHAGEFQKAAELGDKAGAAGCNVASKATNIYANYLEKSEKRKLELFQQVAFRCEQQIAAAPKDPNPHYHMAYALGRYGQGISVVKALAQGLGGRIRDALEKAIKLQPKHADAHVALGTYHAEVIDKVGAMVGGLTYGAKKDVGLKHFQTALKLNPDSAVYRIEYANALAMLEGKKALKQAEQLYQEAAEFDPLDAMERLDVELARAELED